MNEILNRNQKKEVEDDNDGGITYYHKAAKKKEWAINRMKKRMKGEKMNGEKK